MIVFICVKVEFLLLVVSLLMVCRKVSIIIYLTVSLQSDVLSSSGSSFQTAKLAVIPNHRHILKNDMTLNSLTFLLFKVI